MVVGVCVGGLRVKVGGKGCENGEVGGVFVVLFMKGLKGGKI